MILVLSAAVLLAPGNGGLRALHLVAEAGHVDLATVALRKIARQVTDSGAVLSPDAMRHFAGLLAKMGALKASR